MPKRDELSGVIVTFDVGASADNARVSDLQLLDAVVGRNGDAYSWAVETSLNDFNYVCDSEL
jgi:hypothetical protein